MFRAQTETIKTVLFRFITHTHMSERETTENLDQRKMFAAFCKQCNDAQHQTTVNLAILYHYDELRNK